MFGFRFTIRSRRVLVGAWLMYWAAMAIATHLPVPDGLRIPIREGDKLLHVLMYFVLTMLGGRVLLSTPAPPTPRRLAMWALVYAAYGAIDEALQPLVGRHASVQDWIANVFGILLASSILSTQLDRGQESPGDAAK
ncbi:MAG: hypothetical protein FLDDKLPJ_00788 [Phycisphaerae bacterium]|nr:hypothetical protein [Phycisphaerae bacterium]